MNIGYFEDAGYEHLLPLTWLRAAFELRCGYDRLIDKLRRHVPGRLAGLWVRPTVAAVVEERTALDAPNRSDDWCLINARALLAGDVAPPRAGVAWCHNGALLAVGVRAADVEKLTSELFLNPAQLDEWLGAYKREQAPECVRLVDHPWNLPLWNATELQRQFTGGGVHKGQIDPGAHLLQPGDIHLASGARIKPGAVLDPEHGPIFIERDALIEPNAVLQGPCYIGPRCVIRPNAVIREGTTIGPVCRVGGEISASIVHAYTNKQHDGFLGHSYVGEWVNLGADTVTSNLKNTYGPIRVFINGVGVDTGQRFVGATIGDHSKTGIGTILPTGCVIGVAANVFTPGTVPKFVPSFAWLTDAGLVAYRVDKAIQIAQLVMGRRDLGLSTAQCRLLEHTADLARTVEAAGWT